MECSIIPISLGMVNIFAVRGSKTILVDTGTPNRYGKILSELQNHGIYPEDLSLIVLTHNHTDHVGSVYELQKITGAKVAIHSSEAKALKCGKSAEVKPTGILGKLLMKAFKHPPLKGITADIEVEHELDLTEFGVNGKLIHTPGHTPGSISVLLADSQMIVGDSFNGKGHKATKPMFATDLSQLKTTLAQIVKLSPSTIYTSHASICDGKAVEKLISKL